MFDYVMEQICMECVNGEDGCDPFDSSTCPFWGDFDELSKLCDMAEELAEGMKKNVSEDYYTEREEAFRAGEW